VHLGAALVSYQGKMRFVRAGSTRGRSPGRRSKDGRLEVDRTLTNVASDGSSHGIEERSLEFFHVALFLAALSTDRQIRIEERNEGRETLTTLYTYGSGMKNKPSC
jgi:hypothetical protein